MKDVLGEAVEHGEAAFPAGSGPVLTAAESTLIRAAQRGDHEAFERLVRLHERDVMRLAMNLMRSQDDARDVFQEAYLRVYRSLPSFRFDSAFSTWVYRIVTNVCLDQLRRRRVRAEEPAVIETPEGPMNRLEDAREQRAHGDPEREVRARQMETRIGEGLAELTPRERMVFELRHYQGLRLRAIGEITGTTEEAARNCLFRATRKMREVLGEFL